MSVLTHIDRDEGFRGAIAEPWTCGNIFCGDAWDTRPETVECKSNHDVTLCPNCVYACRSCDGKFCASCLKLVNYGDGSVWNCAECIKDAEENLDRCANCGRLRCDLKEMRDEEPGYRSSAAVCGDCRKRVLK